MENLRNFGENGRNLKGNLRGNNSKLSQPGTKPHNQSHPTLDKDNFSLLYLAEYLVVHESVFL